MPSLLGDMGIACLLDNANLEKVSLLGSAEISQGVDYLREIFN